MLSLLPASTPCAPLSFFSFVPISSIVPWSCGLLTTLCPETLLLPAGAPLLRCLHTVTGNNCSPSAAKHLNSLTQTQWRATVGGGTGGGTPLEQVLRSIFAPGDYKMAGPTRKVRSRTKLRLAAQRKGKAPVAVTQVPSGQLACRPAHRSAEHPSGPASLTTRMVTPGGFWPSALPELFAS